MTGINKRSSNPGNGQKKMSYDDRVRNYYGHEAADLKAREMLQKKGVKSTTPNMPSANYTFDGPEKLIKESDKRKKGRK